MKKLLIGVVVVALLAVFLAVPNRTAQAANLDLNAICQSQGMTLVLLFNNVFGWACKDTSGDTHGMDLESYCQSRYGSQFHATYLNSDKPSSWGCFPIQSKMPIK